MLPKQNFILVALNVTMNGQTGKSPDAVNPVELYNAIQDADDIDIIAAELIDMWSVWATEEAIEKLQNAGILDGWNAIPSHAERNEPVLSENTPAWFENPSD